jgi:hypothetical protein
VGIETKSEHFSEADRTCFKQRLNEGLRALDRVLQQPGFGEGPHSIGAELELTLVDAGGRALPIAEQVVRAANDPAITPEMGSFDIELCTPPVALAGRPFTFLRSRMKTQVEVIQRHAAVLNGRAVPISILPTLRLEDFHLDSITNLPRYRALARGMLAARDAPFDIHIEGDDSLSLQSDHAVAMEAANTAFQVHLRTTPRDFTDLFNAASLLSGPVMAAAANSPTFLGRRLWHETRVALFKQAGDDRSQQADADNQPPPRVNFGNGWVREGAHELFMESVALHQPLLAECGSEADPMAVIESGKLPQLSELRLHHGTVWSWNRPVYDPDHGGNLRIELRALPAGPTYDDMLANAGFLLGAMLGLKSRMNALTSRLPFALAKQNFYRAAQFGLDAELAWPTDNASAPETVRAGDLLLSLLPQAYEGLAAAGVDPREAQYFLGILEARTRSGQTGAVWQRTVLSKLNAQGCTGYAASAALLERYIKGVESERPVHTWTTETTVETDEHITRPVRLKTLNEAADV